MSEVIPRDELRERVVFAVLSPMARLAADFKVPLGRIKQLAELAYYRENRRRGHRMQTIQDVMGIGFSKVGTLSKKLKEHYSRPGSGLGLRRRIILLLWAVPLTEKHVGSAFPDVDSALVIAELKAMVAEGQLIEVAGRTPTYQVASQLAGLVEDRWVARMEALSSLMTNVTQVVQQRFFDDPGPAFVRTLNFRARPEEIERLEKVYREVVLPLVQELDAQVGPECDSVPVKLTYLWSRDGERDADTTQNS